MQKKDAISTEAYKGVRDFYPEDMAIQNYLFGVMRKTVESFGYEEYSASVLEPAELYRAKSGEEIVSEQTYTFTDRGGREVTLRPEMTPTVARLVAAKRKALAFPLRWYSIPNLFRYEQPQRGRLREHFQLNVDLFGVHTIDAEVEMISIASAILENFGLKQSGFEIRVNCRRIMNYMLRDHLKLTERQAHTAAKLIDRKAKIPTDEFREKISAIAEDRASEFLTMLESSNFEDFIAPFPQDETVGKAIDEMRSLLSKLEAFGVTNVVFDQSLMRGFDYYTGIVFEVFDTSPENRRSLFGGGRYDELLDIFGAEPVPTVGFGMGDVVTRDVLETYGLLPAKAPPAKLYVIPMLGFADYAGELAQALRQKGIKVGVDLTGRKVGDGIKYADKYGIPFATVVGETEKNTGRFKVKHLKTGLETETDEEKVTAILK